MGRQSRGKAARRRGEPPPVPSRRAARPHAARAPAPPLPIADDSAALVPWAEIWRRDGAAFAALFVLALAFRLEVLYETARSPFLEVTNIDSASYHAWAQQIVAGQWWPVRTFYQSPFYAYFLAVLYRLFGDGPWAPRLVQVAVGSLLPLLVYGVAARLHTRRVAWIAALATCLYGPIVLEEVTLSKTSPLIVAAFAGLAAYLRWGPGAHPGGLAAAGALFGVAVVGVAQWLLPFLALGALVPWLAAGLPRARRLGAAGAFLGAGLLTMAPVVLWNSVNGGGAVLTSGGAGLNFFSGNNERATGLPARPFGLRDIPEFEEDDARRLAEEDVGRPLRPAEVDRYWTRRGLEYIRAHPGDWLVLLRRKLTVLWNAYEVPDNYHFAFMRRHFIWALYASTTLALVGSLALVGMAVPFWRWRGLVAFHVAWLTYMVTPLIYYVRGRYRMPLAPFLAILAAVAVERVLRAATVRRWDVVGALGGGALVAAVAVNHTYCEPPHHGFPSICFAGDAWFDQEWLKLALWYQERGDVDGALDAVEHAQETSAPRSEGQLLFWRGDVERRKGDALVAAGDSVAAREHFRAAAAAYGRCVALGYRPQAAAGNRDLVEQRIARLP
jgi:4-amino-4-deoxy-L-arabinose transferase-like glycosyltransferase